MPDSPSDRRKRKKTERDRERREDEAKDDHDQPVRKRNRTNEDRRDDQYRQSARRSRTNEEKNADQENGSRKSIADEEKKNDQDQPVSKKTKNNPDAENLLTRTGGAYIPPARLRAMQAQITDKSSTAYQRISWEALKKSINGLINKVNVSNITNIVAELFQENIVRGRGLLARSVISAQSASPTFTHVYAALVAIINTKFPQTGELILKRLIIQFRKGFRRNDKKLCLSSVSFIAHLVNQQVAHEIVALEILTLLLENPTDDSVEVAVGFLKEVGSKLTEVSPRGIVAIFERLRSVLHEGVIDKRVQYMVEVMFATRKDGFKDHVAVIEELDLVEEEDQFTHMITLDDAVSGEELLNVFRNDPDFQTNEEKYKQLKKEILDEDSDEGSGSGSSSGSDSSDSDEEDEESEQMIIDQTETNMIALRRTIYLTIQSSLDFEECAHKMLKMELKPGQEVELCNMILDCCAQMRTYEKFFGLLAQRFCMIDKKYVEPFQQMFIDQYSVIHRLETNKLRNVGKFFSHLLHTDSISWEVLQHIKLNEDDTTSSSRIFIKILFQDLSEYMGLPKLNQRLKDPTLQIFFEGLLPRDNPRNCRFAINFFTSIGLGGLTDELRAHLKNMPKQIMQEKVASESSSSSASSSSSSSSSSDSSSSDSSDDSSSESEEENSRKRKPEKKKKLPSKSKTSRTREEKEINVRNKHHKSKDQPHPEEQRNSKHKSGRRNGRSEERIDHRQRSKSDSDDEVRVERGHKKHKKVVDSYGNSSSESRRVKNRESHKPSPKVDTRKDKYSKGRVNGDKERRRRMSDSGSNSSDDDSDDGDEAEYDQRERSRYEDMETDRRAESRRGGRRPDDARHSSRESGRREDRRQGTGREPVPYGRRGESSRRDYETQNKDHRDNRRQARQEELSDDEHYRRQRNQHQSEEVRRVPASRERPGSRQEASRYDSDDEGSRERPSSRSKPSRYDSDQERDSRRQPYRDDGISSTRLPERHKYQERTDDRRHYSGRNYLNDEENIRVSPGQRDHMISRQQGHRRERNHPEQHKQPNSDDSESESDSSSEEEYTSQNKRSRAEERSRGQGHPGERQQERYENGVSTDSSDDETESHRRNSDRKHISNRDSDRHRQRMVQTVKHQESSSSSSDDSDHSRNHRNNKHDRRDEQRQQKATSSSDSDSSESSDDDDNDDGKTVSNDRRTIRSQIQKVQLNSDSDSNRKSRNEKYIQENRSEETSSSSESEKSDDQEEQNYKHQYRTRELDREKHRAIQREEERDYQRRRDYDNRERNYDPREHRDIREDRREYRDNREDRRYYRDNRDNRREYKDNRDDRREYRDSRDDRREYRDNRDYDRRSSRRTEYY